MAENLEAVGLELDATQYERALRRIERRTKNLEDTFDGVTAAAGRQQSRFDGLGRRVVQLAAAYGAFRVLDTTRRFIFDTNVEFQKLEATLGTVTGSAEEGGEAFGLITDFAKTTPFEIQNLTRAFINLRVRGLDPTRDDLRGLGNFASAFTEDITTLSEAIVSASAGMSRPLRRFGVDASISGDEITLSFQGVTRTVSRTTEEISRFLAEMGNTRFADAMADRMETLDGRISNLQDSASILAREIGREGLNAEIQGLVEVLDNAIQEGDEFASFIGGGLASGVRVGTAALETFIRHQELVITGLQVLAGATLAQGLLRTVRLLGQARGAMVALSAAMAANPVGVIVTLAGAIGGPLLLNLLTAKDAAEELADEIERLEGPEGALSAFTGEQLQNLERRLQESISAREQALLTGAPGGTMAAIERMEARLQAVRREMQRRQTLPGVSGGPGPGPDEDVQEEIEKLIRSLEEERIKLEEGERAAFAYRLEKEGITGQARDQLLALFDQVRGLEAEADAREDARKELEKQTEAAREWADEVLRSVEAQEAQLQVEAARLGSERFVAELQAEAEQVKATADRMADAFTDFSVDVLTSAELSAQAISDMADSMIRDFQRLFVRRLITEPLVEAAVFHLTTPGAPTVPGPDQLPVPEAPVLSRAGGFQASGRAASQTVVNQRITFAPSFIDSRDGERWLRENKGAIAAAMLEATRDSRQLRRALVTGES